MTTIMHMILFYVQNYIIKNFLLYLTNVSLLIYEILEVFFNPMYIFFSALFRFIIKSIMN